jgi:hypothetical protein
MPRFVRTTGLLVAATSLTALGLSSASASSAAPAASALPTAATQTSAQIAPQPGGWSKPGLTHESAGGRQRVSCPSTSFCMAVDQYGWSETFDGSSWGTPTRVVPDSALTQVFPDGTYVSCASSLFCVAVESQGSPAPPHAPGYAEVWNGSTWGAPTRIAMQYATSIDCPSTTLCLVADALGNVLTFDGSTWSAPVAVDPNGELAAISCASTTFCMAVGDGSRAQSAWAYQFDGSTWSASPDSKTRSHFGDVSCPTRRFCMAVTERTYAVFDGTHWMAALRQPVSSSAPGSVSCAAADRCTATAGTSWEKYVDGTWTTGDLVPSAAGPILPQTLACPATSDCIDLFTSVAGRDIGGIDSATSDGFATRYDGTAWESPELVDPAHGPVTSASCPRASSCVVVDADGWAQTRTGGALNAPIKIDPLGYQYLTGVSCPTTAFCAASDYQGRVATFSFDGAGTLTMVDKGHQLTSITCGSSTLCEALTDDDLLVGYDGIKWSTPSVPVAGFVVSAVSCPTTSFCQAVGMAGGTQPAATVYNGSTWATPVPLAGTDAPSLLSCGSTTLCAAQVADRQMQIYDGTGWQTPTTVDPHTTNVEVSCGTAVCALGMYGYDGGDHYGIASVYTDGAWSTPVQIDGKAAIDHTACAPNGTCIATARDFAFTHHAG